MKSFIADVIHIKKIARDIYELVFTCPEDDIKAFRAGQFAHIKIPQSEAMLLRRPFSINNVDLNNRAVTVIYQVAGEGTKRFMEKKSRTLDVLMSLGNGFPRKEEYKSILLIGGGIGVAPLRSVAENFHAKFDAILGYKSKEYAFQTDVFKKLCGKVMVASDDGSIGQKGLVTKILKNFELSDYDAVFTCGPRPMLKALQSYFLQYSLPVYASLEERMGCGMGGCAVCVCKIKNDNDSAFKKVCTEGPVFLLSEVDFS